MPRGAWLAVGAATAAMLATVAGSGPMAALVISGALGLVPVAAILAARRRPREAALVAGLASIGLRLTLGGLTAPAVAVPPVAAVDGSWAAQVLTLGSTSDGQQRATLLVETAGFPVLDGRAPHGPWRVYGWLPRYPVVIPTDRIAFDGSIEPVREDGSEFANYLAGIDAVATVRISHLTVAGAPAGPFGIAERLRAVADAALARVLPEPMAGLASGILVGRRDRVSREVADSFTTTGLSHVVAISGWNICLIGAVVGGMLRAAGMSRRSRTIAIVVALTGFTLLAGGGASVVRAALMGGVALVARETGRPGTAAAALGLAVWLLLVLDPAMVTDIGFQLSVAATAGLLAWGSALTRRLLGAAPGRPRRWLAESLGVSLAAQVATLPLVLFHFGRLSLVSPVANLVVAPIVAPAMLVGAVALVAGLVVGAGLPVVVGAPFALLGWLVLGSMVAISGLFSSLPGASLELPSSISMMSAAGITVALGLVAWRWRGHEATDQGLQAVAPAPLVTPTPGSPDRPRSRPRKRAAVGLAGITVLAGLGIAAMGRTGPGRLTVTVLDVGQGDAILVEGPRGGRILLDSGPDPDRLLLVLDRHVPAWDRRLDLVVVTHPHEDHVAGLAMLLARYRVAAIAENGMQGAGPGDAAFRDWLALNHVTTRRFAAGDRLALDGIGIDILWPNAGEVPARAPSAGRAVNDSSVVLDIRYGDRRMLLTGDIEDDVDPRLLQTGIAGDGAHRLDVLKVAHHGSRTATSDPWLDALRPRVALISAGTGNPYGHPAPETVARLQARDARVLRTDLDGDLQVSSDGHDLQVASSGGRKIAAATTGAGGTATAALVPATARAGGSAALVPAGTAPIGLLTPSPFLCAIPLSRARLAALPAPEAAHSPTGRPLPPRRRPDDPRRSDGSVAGIWSATCYDRLDDGALPRGRGRPPPVALAQAVAGPARRGRRGRRVVPRRRRAPRGPPCGPRGWWRRQRSCTTSTRPSLAATRCAPSATDTQAPDGSPIEASRSSLRPSTAIPSAVSMTARTRTGCEPPPSSSASWRMPTSALTNASSRSTSASPDGPGSIPTTPGCWLQRASGRRSSKPRSAASPACHPVMSAATAGPPRRFGRRQGPRRDATRHDVPRLHLG